MLYQGISDLVSEKDEKELLMGWYEYLDELYFCRDERIIELSEEDKKVLCENPECKLKLKIISFKPNITLKNAECLYED